MTDQGDVSLEGTGADVTSPDADETGQLVRSSGVVALGTLLSRVTGLVRVAALTYAVGALALADAYNLANTTPNIVYELLLGGVLSATLVPVFVDRFEDRDDAAVSAFLTVATVALAVLTAIAVLAAPLLFAVYGQEELEDAGVPLLRLFLPQILFYGWTALASAVLNARRRFTLPAFAPVLNNVVVCGTLVAFGLRFGSDPSLESVADDRVGLLLLGLGTTLGIVAMTVPLMIALRGTGVRWRFDPGDDAVRTVVRRAGWTIGYVAANQIALTIMFRVSADALEGLPSAYTYAFIFFQLPHGLIAVSVMTTFIPELASAWNNVDLGRFRDRFGQGMRLVLTGVVPATAILAVAAAPLVSAVLERGAFSGESTGDVLTTMALGLPGFSMYLFALRGFYAQGDTRTPFVLNVVENGLQVALTIALVPNVDRPGLALGAAYAIAYSVSAVAALAVLHRRVGGVVDSRLVAAMTRLAAAAGIAVTAGLVAREALPDGTATDDLLEAAVLVGVTGAVFVGAAMVMGVTEVRSLVAAVTGRSEPS
jgi:putative peptidoglycan lipid II flippase